MTVQFRVTKILSTLLIAGLCTSPLLRAQQTNPATPQQAPETSQQPPATQPAPTDQAQPNNATAPAAAPAQNTQPATPANQTQPQQQPSRGTNVDPSQAPLTPVTTYPDASDTPQQQPAPDAAPAQTTTVPEGPKPKPQTEPVGAATAESVPTTGGAAAKPAGIAIAPAKQHQTRSLLLKIGAVAAAGAALGTIFALSHSTSSTPPGAALPGVTGR